MDTTIRRIAPRPEGTTVTSADDATFGKVLSAAFGMAYVPERMERLGVPELGERFFAEENGSAVEIGRAHV